MKGSLKHLFVLLAAGALCLPLGAAVDVGRKVEGAIPLAVWMIRSGNLDDAERLLNDAEKLDPDNDAVQYYKGIILLYRNQDDKNADREKKAEMIAKAAGHFARAAELDSTNVWYAKKVGDIAFMFNQNELAKRQYGRYLKEKIYDPDILVRIAGMYTEEQNWNQADSLLHVVETIEGENAVVEKMKLDIKYMQEKYDVFFPALRAYVTSGIDTPGEQFMVIAKYMGDALRRDNKNMRGEFNEVVQCFIDANASDGSVAYMSAQLYGYMGDYERVLKLCESNPDDIKLLLLRVSINQMKGIFTPVLEDCDKIISLAGEDKGVLSDAHCTKGDCLQHLGRYRQACEEYELSLAANPDNVVCLNNYAYFMACNGKKLKKCLAMIDRVIAAEPENPTYLDTYGWVLYKQKKYKEAKEVFKKVMQYGGKKSSESLLHYAAVLDALNETALADSYRTQAEMLK